ncbi:murein hydrolase activator EnvC family protein [Altererythrobacter sp. MF3-039]|uniref:murein hydrolase activator EnvC family protein n=1 Tax=Altererythrobacter sp. MF3-039 TaxID=3252901 RepID=UPI00390CC57E
MSSASPADARSALNRAEADLRAADMRAETLEEQARLAEESAEKAQRDGAALAARIQQSEAAITATEARLALIQDQQAAIDLGLAEKRAPLMQLTAALQRLSRRPMALSALRSGSLKDAVYLRAMLATTVPQVEERTRSLRTELQQSRELASAAQSALGELEQTERQLAERKRQMSALEASQRMASRQASAAARRENERAFALAEQARDLDALVGEIDRAGELRRSLAALPGPVLRPSRPGASRVAAPSAPSPGTNASPPSYRLPVTGRTLAGFGERTDNGPRRTDLLLAPRASAIVVAPADGRIAFAGPYRGYRHIVIIEHSNGWTSLVTGMARADARVGAKVVGGAPIGVAPARNPRVTLELRRAGTPVNPLSLVG